MPIKEVKQKHYPLGQVNSRRDLLVNHNRLNSYSREVLVIGINSIAIIVLGAGSVSISPVEAVLKLLTWTVNTELDLPHSRNWSRINTLDFFMAHYDDIYALLVLVNKIK